MNKLLILTMLLTGCATGKWMKLGAGQSDWYRNKVDCEIKAKAVNMNIRTPQPYNMPDYAYNNAVNNSFNECMMGEGWRYTVTQN